MRDEHDALSKDLLIAALEDVGEIVRGVETSATSQRMDLLFRPDAEHRAERQQRGLLGALVDERLCNLEPYRNTPTMERVRDCLRRLWTHHHGRAVVARKEGKEPPPMARVVVLSPGRPETALLALRMTRHATLPLGVYESHAEVGLWIVVLSELPVTRETLALRLLGRGEVQSEAVRSLMQLPRDAWERRLIEILLRWRQTVIVDLQGDADKEAFMQETRRLWEVYRQQLHDSMRGEIVEEIRGEVIEEIRGEVREEVIEEIRGEVRGEVREEVIEEIRGEVRGEVIEEIRGEVRGEVIEEIRGEVREEVRAEAVQPLAHQMERRLGRALSTEERASLVARFARVGPVRLGDVVLDLTRDELAAWLADPLAS